MLTDDLICLIVLLNADLLELDDEIKQISIKC